jgi:LysM repeat protein
MVKLSLISLSALVFIVAVIPASAQTPESPPGPVYYVQEGDTLWDIASRFNVSVADIVIYNNLPGQDIFVGDRLVIPGLENLSGILTIQPVPFGETLRSLSRQNNVDPETLVELNRIVSPAELFAGYGLILLQQENAEIPSGRDSLKPGETLLELAVRQNTHPWEVARVNKLERITIALPGDVLSVLEGQAASAPSGFPSVIASAELDPLPISQGDTVQIKVIPIGEVILSGILVDHTLRFFPTGDGSQVALQGVYAMLDPGIYPLQLTTTLPDGSQHSFEQMVLVKSGNFFSESLYVDDSLIDPVVTDPENQWLFSVVALVTPEKFWQGIFQFPVASDMFCVRSGFGNRRAYNDGELYSFHAGLDFGVCSESHPFDIYSPAAGVVVFVGEKTVRGKATIIDHGWGIYSGMWHQEEILVALGDRVEAGQLIGMIGATGRVTGPHLHWEIWANGVQADPLQWLEEEFPHD